MSAFRKVAVLGGSGNLGPYVIKALLNAGFEVTAITRLESQATFVDGINIKRIDITSKAEVENVLQGHDVLVSTIASAAIGDQKTIIDAAVAAKVRRFIPSEYGVDTRLAEKSLGWVAANKNQVNDYLVEVAKKNEWFTWTGLVVGLFFDWGIQSKFLLGLNAQAKTAIIIDSGNKRYAATNVYVVGEAVAAILKKPEETANKSLTVFSFVTTQNEVLKIFEEESGSKYQITHVKGSDLQKKAIEDAAKGARYSSVGNYVQYAVFSDESNDPVNLEKNHSELLGVKDTVTLRDSIKRELKELN